MPNTPVLIIIPRIHKINFTNSLRALISACLEDNETVDCTFENHKIAFGPNKIFPPLCDLLLSKFAPQSESALAVKINCDV